MSKTNYSYNKIVGVAFEQAVEKVKFELEKEGFGILTEIDVRETLKKKINVDFDSYVILGACNPSNAYKSLQVESEIGLMLPCNVIVYKKEGSVFISSILPTVAMGMVNNELLKDIAVDIEHKLKKVIDNV